MSKTVVRKKTNLWRMRFVVFKRAVSKTGTLAEARKREFLRKAKRKTQEEV
ncbi:hypothetical protein GCM10020331_038700 [Ectobacillus funiculus]